MILLLLRKHKKWNQFTSNQLQCPICGTQINYDNIGLTLEDKKELYIVCLKRTCINRFLSDLLERS